MVTVLTFIQFRTNVRLRIVTNVKFKFIMGQVTVVVTPIFVNRFVLEHSQTVAQMAQWFSVTC